MNKIILNLFLFAVCFNCKNDITSDKKQVDNLAESNQKTAKQNDGLTLLKGAFVYHGGAAVLQTHANIYGVLPSGKFKELNKKVEPYKTEPTDMVQIEVRGKITTKTHKTILWENKVEILEILSVKPISKENNKTIKLGS